MASSYKRLEREPRFGVFARNQGLREVEAIICEILGTEYDPAISSIPPSFTPSNITLQAML